MPFVVVKRRWYRCLLFLHNRRFSWLSHYKKFQNIFSTNLNCLFNLCTFTQAMRLFSYFFFVTLLHLSYKRDISYFLCNPFFRSSHWRCSVKSDIPTKFHMKRPILESLFNNVAAWHCTFSKDRLQHWYFPTRFAKFFRTSISWNICKRLPFLFLSN